MGATDRGAFASLIGLLSALGPTLGAGAGGPAYPLGDLRPGFGNSYSSASKGPFIAYGGDIVFNAYDPRHGFELRRFDGAEVTVLEDIHPGPRSGAGFTVVELGGRLYFGADDGALGSELWVSDGTAAGTLPVVDLCPGACAGLRSEPVVAGGRLWFAGDDGLRGAEPWVSDGTAAGTLPVADVCPGSCGSAPSGFTEWNGRIWFAAAGASGRELWVTDGTAAGTEQETDICPGLCSASPELLTPWAGHLYFAAKEPATGQEVWRTDGAGNVARVTDLYPGPLGSLVIQLAPFAGHLYIRTADCSAAVPCLWRTDGTAAGTAPAFELLVHGPATSVSGLVVAEDRLFLAVYPGDLWAWDGLAPAAQPVATGFRVVGWSLARFGDRAVFEGRTPAMGGEPWISDGTPAGTFQLADVTPGATGSAPRFTESGGHLLFSADRDAWMSDGTPAGTHRFADFGVASANGIVGPIASLGDRAYFTAIATGPGPMTLWSTDGTAADTQPALIWDYLDDALHAIDGQLYFFGRPPGGPTTGFYASDGTPAGAKRLANEGTQVTPALGAVYFSTVWFGQQLWITDGTPGGTGQVIDVNPNYTTTCPILCPPIPDYPRQLTDAGELLFFVAFEPGSNLQLWVSDGTAVGTWPLHTFPDGDPGPAELTAHAGGLLFAALTDGGGVELWWSDGTPAGTGPIADLARGPRSSNPHGFTRLGTATLFVAADQTGGDQLWRAEGAPPVVSRVRALTAGGVRAQAGPLFAAGARVYFPLFHPLTGRELWASDGTTKGTGLVVDLRPGPGGSYPNPLRFAAGRLFFAADDGETGLELWATDGTAAGTALVGDLAPGPRPSNPNTAAPAGDLLVFFADDGVHGNEPWAVDPAAVGSAPVPPMERAGIRGP